MPTLQGGPLEITLTVPLSFDCKSRNLFLIYIHYKKNLFEHYYIAVNGKIGLRNFLSIKKNY